MRNRPLMICALLLLALPLAHCRPAAPRVVVVGDSHSDPDRVPALDWLAYAPPEWTLVEHATAGHSCRQAIPPVFDAEAMAGSDHLVIFCGSNDAGRSDWDLAVTAGWIEMGIVAGLLRGLEVVVVVPPPVFRNYPVHRSVRNGRLRDLRDAIYALAAEHGVVVADVWLESFLQPVPASHFPDGLHFDEAGRAFAAAAIAEAVAAWIPPPSDRDADGVPDATDLCPSHRSPLFGLNHADTDGDGAGDACDNCRETPNGPLLPDAGGNAQRDDDGDGYGNACDCDFDGDCLCDGDDFDRLLPVLAAGHDAEGIGADMDGNGALDADDFSRFLASLARGAPGPGAASGAPPPPD